MGLILLLYNNQFKYMNQEIVMIYTFSFHMKQMSNEKLHFEFKCMYEFVTHLDWYGR
jgi:hypothetical protein